jgi:hypothetical protein
VIGPQRFLALILFALTAASVSSAATYYVTQSGAGGKDATSLASAWPVTAYSASSAPGGGDTVVFSGTLTSKVTIPTSGSSNSSRLTLDFTGATFSGCNPCISLTGKAYLNILGGSFWAASSGSMIETNQTVWHDVTISGWTFKAASNSTASFIDMYYPQNVTISNNTIDNATLGYSDSTKTHDILISGNFIRSSTNTATQTDVISFGDAYNVTIEKNKLVNQAPGNSANSRHNDVIQTFRSGSSPNGNPTNWVIRYNWIQVAQPDGSGGNMSWHELENFAGQPALKIYGNVYVGDTVSWAGGNGVSLHSGTNSSDTYYFYNNTMYVHSAPLNPLRLGEGDGPGTVFFANNVLASDSGQCDGDCPQITFSAGAPFNDNFFFNWDQCSSSYVGKNGSCNTNPLFSSASGNDFSLQSTSSLINHGDSTIGAEYNQGIAPGATWPNPKLATRTSGTWDVGAYQSGGGSAGGSQPPTPPANLSAVVQ